MCCPVARFLLLAGVAGLVLVGGLSCRREGPDALGKVPAFTLTERSGQDLSDTELRGKVWIASFVFTRCTGPCPQVTRTMERLQKELHLARRDDLRLVTFTVDPERDQPRELQNYARHFEADPKKWLFLTGKKEEIHRLLVEGFKVAVREKPAGERKPGDEFEHSTHLVVVDRDGNIRGYFWGLAPSEGGAAGEEMFEEDLGKLRETVRQLSTQPIDFPLLNASLNGAAGVLLVLGYLAVRRRHIALHKASMLTALIVSSLFLACYLYYHFAIQHGRPTYFSERAPEAPSWVGKAYHVILGSHIVLATVVVPLALYVSYQGLRDRIARHVRLARWLLPVWLYVSVTGVVVYWMLYRLYPVP
jgi:protein SCO1/2/putative membrane protein